MDIIWSKQAEISYVEILEFLQYRWTKKELSSFKQLTNEILFKISTKQVSFPFENKKLKVQKAVIHKNVSLYYIERKSKIILVTFFDNRKNPKALREILK